MGSAQEVEQMSTTVSMKNLTLNRMEYSKYHNWEGSLTLYSPSINIGGEGKLIHKANEEEGSKGGVVYTGRSSVSKTVCGWLLAWSAPKSPSLANPNRVFVNCGDAANFKNLNWGLIETFLNVSDQSSNFIDPITGSTITANILPGALVAATFGAN